MLRSAKKSAASAANLFSIEYQSPYGSIAGQAQSVDIAKLGEIGLHLFFMETVRHTPEIDDARLMQLSAN
jgi:hypothetical protein